MAKTKSKATGRSASRKAPRVTREQKKASWLAKGYPVLSSVTMLDDCARAIDWYRKVLGASQRLRLDMPGGMVAHCELGFGDSVLMLGSPMPPQFPPKKASLGIYVKDCDAIYQEGTERGRALTPGTRRPVLRRSQCTIRGSLRQRVVRDDPRQGRQRAGDEEGDGPDGWGGLSRPVGRSQRAHYEDVRRMGSDGKTWRVPGNDVPICPDCQSDLARR